MEDMSNLLIGRYLGWVSLVRRIHGVLRVLEACLGADTRIALSQPMDSWGLNHTTCLPQATTIRIRIDDSKCYWLTGTSCVQYNSNLYCSGEYVVCTTYYSDNMSQIAVNHAKTRIWALEVPFRFALQRPADGSVAPSKIEGQMEFYQ